MVHRVSVYPIPHRRPRSLTLPRPTIEAFDAWLSAAALRLDAIVVGGSALSLLGLIERQTRDFDILHPRLSVDIIRAAVAFAVQQRAAGVELSDEWLNNGPMQLVGVLPEGWRLRLRPAFQGVALTLTTLGRLGLAMTKLFALCDRGTDLADCIELATTTSELAVAEPWLVTQDTNPMWPDHVRSILNTPRTRLGHAL